MSLSHALRGRAITASASLALAATLTVGTQGLNSAAALETGATASTTTGTAYLTVDESTLQALPTSGGPWLNLLAVANGGMGTVNLANQDNTHAGRVLAAALVYARTGTTSYRDKAIAQLRTVGPATLAGARVLSVSRQIAGYAVAADLVDYRDPTFVSFMSGIRTRYIGGHSRWYALSQTSEDTASNWGSWALSSRIAVDAYVGDTADMARAAKVFRGFLGDRTAYAGFRRTSDFDPTWVCGASSAWVPINPADCGDKAGAIVEDISRSAGAYPLVDSVGRTYSWETLGGATMSAKLLSRHGYADVYDWSGKALLRAAQFLQRKGGYAPGYSTNQYIPWSINKAYSVNLGPVNPARAGREYGFTDWLP